MAALCSCEGSVTQFTHLSMITRDFHCLCFNDILNHWDLSPTAYDSKQRALRVGHTPSEALTKDPLVASQGHHVSLAYAPCFGVSSSPGIPVPKSTQVAQTTVPLPLLACYSSGLPHAWVLWVAQGRCQGLVRWPELLLDDCQGMGLVQHS